MLGKMLVFCFCVLGIYALIMAAMPPEFITAGETYNPSYQSVNIEEEFNANKMLVYDHTGSDNMTFTLWPYNEYSSLYEGPVPPDWEAGLPENQFLEVWWGSYSEDWFPAITCIRLTHKQRNWFLGSYWFSDINSLICSFTNGTVVNRETSISREDVIDAVNPVTNDSCFTAKTDVITTNLLIKPFNETKDMATNWDEGHLNYAISYSVNFSAMNIGAFTIIGNLLSFKAPSLGITGPWGSFLNMLIAIPLWSCIAYIVFKIIAGLIPFVSGGSGD